MATINTIRLKNYSDVFEEYAAGAAIVPGSLVELTPATADTVRVHATAGGNAIPMFALEDELQGKGINDDYATGDRVQVWIPGRGDQVYALLKDEQDIAIGDFMESAGLGQVQKHAADVGDSTVGGVQNAIIGVAIEKKELSSAEGSESSAGGLYHNPRIKIRIV